MLKSTISEFRTYQWMVETNMPKALGFHCSVMLPDDTIMITGGYQENGGASDETFIYNPQTETWTQGPSMNFKRDFHSCGVVRIDKRNFAVVVAGKISFFLIGISKLCSMFL